MDGSVSETSSSLPPESHEWRAAWQARRVAAAQASSKQAGSKQVSANLRQLVAAGPKIVRDVWTWNFEDEFQRLVAVTAKAKGGAVLAFDTEFPGLLCQESCFSAQYKQYEALRSNIGLLQPIQFGISVANVEGSHLGTWSFNMHFDVGTNLYVEGSLEVLEAAGVDFQRHASHGLSPTIFGECLAGSALVGIHENMPQWITFDGVYDFGYLLKLLTGHPLPRTLAGFHASLNDFCPRRFDLRERMTHGSLEHWMHKFGMEYKGDTRTVSSDALATLELYFITKSVPLTQHLQPEPSALHPPPPGLEPPVGLEQPLRVEGLEPPPGLVGAETTECTGAHSSADAECVAPSSLWAAAARQAVIEAALANSTAS